MSFPEIDGNRSRVHAVSPVHRIGNPPPYEQPSEQDLQTIEELERLSDASGQTEKAEFIGTPWGVFAGLEAKKWSPELNTRIQKIVELWMWRQSREQLHELFGTSASEKNAGGTVNVEG